MSENCFPENFGHVAGIVPQADGAITSDIVSLKNANKAWVKVVLNQTNAAQSTTTLMQAQDVSGTGGKAISSNVPIWANQDLASDDRLTRQADAKTFQFSATLKQKVVWFQIDPAQCMDINNGFDCIYITSGGSNAANIIAASFFLNPKYEGATLPSFIID